ncbi:5'/3'-nucleotidase SurE [Rhodococcus sp. WS1]|uniref:5'/3'-nucleotidase SurE n=1 Tax=unclassified Rhodococcus (in: high G+C Gram-positive bacteria) TaxID=192944 RepID=UPI0011412737|nr:MULTISPECIES: 5'/3'-nucleotidase SurE [unclassified Rhodococcus (in: high G+C Gram-positive bacteria)]ROZ52794.1 5'/3'-nucleotidase SurE [Rhodococcus sp. WS1]TQC34319.1 5'/3'-nucleotidase SurE [Rhodococcus sp. WS7]
MKKLNVVVTNDDGIDSPGLHTLAAAVSAAGHTVRVIAPTVQASGAGAGIAALTVSVHEMVERRDLGLGTDDLAVAAEPAMIVLWSVLGCFGPPPDLVMSGINLGSNFGTAVVHSGTFGAALTAVMHAIPAIAVSLCLEDEDNGNVDDILHWDSAAKSAVGMIDHAGDALKSGFAINLNVPNAPIDRLLSPALSSGTSTGLVPSIVPFVHRLKVAESGLVASTSEIRAKQPLQGSDRDIVSSGRPSVSLIGLTYGDTDSLLGIAQSDFREDLK